MESKKTKKSATKHYPKALIEGAIAGNRDDFAKLLESCIRDITYLAQLYVDRQDAEDITQEVAITLQRKIHTVTNPDHFFKWLSVVVRNTSVSYMRKQNKYKDDVELTEYMEASEHSDSFTAKGVEFLPERYVEDAELLSIVMDEIDQLPKRQQVCLSYHYLYEFKRADIVEVTEYDKEQVASALYMGKQTLKKRLEKRLRTTLVFSYVPVGITPVMTRVFEKMQDAIAPKEFCEQLYLTCLEQLDMSGMGHMSGVTEVIPEKGMSIVTKCCIGTAITAVTAGIIGVAVISGREIPPPETNTPPAVISQTEQDDDLFTPDLSEEENSEAEPLQDIWEIRTVADMIGDMEAYILEDFVEETGDPEDWWAFVERIGAKEYDRSMGYRHTFVIYILEKQNKRLLLAEYDPGDGDIRVLYLFGDRDEPVEAMTRIVLRF